MPCTLAHVITLVYSRYTSMCNDVTSNLDLTFFRPYDIADGRLKIYLDRAIIALRLTPRVIWISLMYLW